MSHGSRSVGSKDDEVYPTYENQGSGLSASPYLTGYYDSSYYSYSQSSGGSGERESGGGDGAPAEGSRTGEEGAEEEEDKEEEEESQHSSELLSREDAIMEKNVLDLIVRCVFSFYIFFFSSFLLFLFF